MAVDRCQLLSIAVKRNLSVICRLFVKKRAVTINKSLESDVASKPIFSVILSAYERPDLTTVDTNVAILG